MQSGANEPKEQQSREIQLFSPTKYSKITKKDSIWNNQSLRDLRVLRGGTYIVKHFDLFYQEAMYKKYLWIALFISTIFSAGQCFGQEGKESWISTTDNFLSELELMQGSKEDFTPDTYYAPGGIVCVVIEGEIKFCRPFGYSSAHNIEELIEKPADRFDPSLGVPVKENSLFRLGSTSKMFVGLALAMCKDQGLVHYDDTISKYIDELLDTEAGDTTLKQLFTHSGGLPPLHKPGLRERDDEVTNATMAEIISSVAAISPDSSKIDQFSYSDVGVLLLAEAVSRVQEFTYEAFVRNEILTPLGMTHTYFHTSQIDRSLKTTGYFPNFTPAIDPDLQGYAPVGGMYSTGPDMAKLMSLFQKALNGKEQQALPIKPEVIQDLTSVFLKEDQHAMGVSIDIGYRNGRTMIGHNGRINGYASYFTFAKEAEIGLVFLANGGFPLGRTSAPEFFNRLLRIKSPEAF